MTAPARRVSTRLGAIAPSATLAVDAKAKALKAAGRPVIGFGAGEPDFATPDFIVEAAVAAARDPKNHRYTPATGLPELKDAVAAKTLRDSGYAVDPANVIVTNLRESILSEKQGDLWEPLEKGLIKLADIFELGELAAGDKPGRTDETQITYHKNNNGTGAADLAPTTLAYRKAIKAGRGMDIAM